MLAGSLLPLAAALGAVSAEGQPPAQQAVKALGRIKPKHGLLRLAGPSDDVVVIARLFVEEGDSVTAGQRVATLDTHALRQAELGRAQAGLASREAAVERLQAEARNAASQHRRQDQLFGDGLLTAAVRDDSALRLESANASLTGAKAELESARADVTLAQTALDRSQVRSPVGGRVVKIFAREGERVGASGLLELARREAMYAVAEVYETDVARVRIGQRAVVRSPAMPREWRGVVERIGWKIGKLDVLGTDPAARTDARVVEVEVRLDPDPALEALSNLQVEVSIGPG